MLFPVLWLAGLAAAQSSSSSSSSGSIMTVSGKLTGAEATPTLSLTGLLASTFPTGTTSQLSSGMGSANASGSQTTSTGSLIFLTGGSKSSTLSGNGTASVTSSSVRPTNTQACNGWTEFCSRKYSNITQVCAHNSPFVKKNNAGSNQELDVTTQLNDGIRMLQGQAHLVNGTLYYCHTSCDLLNAGTVQDYLTTVREWVENHPFDVITILFGNYDYEEKDSNGNALVTAKNFVQPITDAGLFSYIYQPPKTVMGLDDWPTLSELIVTGKRVITFIDYNFDTANVPWMLWEFNNMWETPYSPTDSAFPCTVQRPTGLSKNTTENMLYMANHNLNVEVSIAGSSLLIPNTVELNATNAVNGSGSLGNMTQGCTSDWNRPPNFLLVDYYNYGSPFNGSVFQVAADANNVTYNRDKCCGTTGSLASGLSVPSGLPLVVGLIAALALVL